MKKFLCLLICVFLAISFLTSRNGRTEPQKEINENSISHINFEKLGYKPCFEKFSDEVLWVTKTISNYATSTTYYGCIDKNLNLIVPFTNEFDEVQEFSDGRAWVKFNDERKNYNAANWGFIDKSGNVIRRFDAVYKGQHTSFSEGYCLAEGDGSLAPPLFVVHESGKLIQLDRDTVPQGSPFNIRTVHKFKDEYALCVDDTHDLHIYYIKTDGTLLIFSIIKDRRE